MVSILFGFIELFPPLSELFLRLMSVVSAGGSSEAEEHRGNILSEESKEKQMQKIMGRFGCLALG